MREQKVLAALVASRDAYNKLSGFLDKADFSTRGGIILDHIDQFYTIDPTAKAVDLEILGSRIERALVSQKQADVFKDVLAELPVGSSSPGNAAQEYLELKRTAIGDRLASALLSRLPITETQVLVDEYTLLQRATDLESEPKESVERDLRVLMRKELDPTNRIRLLPAALNTRIGGGVNRGDCVVVFGRPNSGKSLFCINAASGFVRDGLRVLWIENEERGNRTLKRIAQRIAQVPADRWMDKEEENLERAYSLGYNNIIYESLVPGTLREVDELITTHKPDVVVVNQFRNMSVKGESFTRQLDVAAHRLRGMGKRHNAVVILVTQAYSPPPDAQGNVRDKPVLYMEDIDSSKTGVPAAGDLIIGYGISRDLWVNKTACLTIAKSKFGSDKEHFYVRVRPEIDKLESK